MRTGLIVSVALTMVVLSISTLLAADVLIVSQRHRAFEMPSLRGQRGQVVRFHNDDQFLHQIYVQSPSFKFESEEQEPGTDVDIKFTEAGLFEVRCHIHPKMLLQVEVR